MHQNKPLSLSKALLQQAIVVTALCAASTVALALPSDRSQQISLVADHATYNDKTGVTTYSGNVVIEQGSMK